jgi:putative transposase
MSSGRLMLEGIVWRFRTGSPWRDLPADFGPWQTVWKRHHRWSLDGTYEANVGPSRGGVRVGCRDG